MAINIRNKKEIESLRAANVVVAQTLKYLEKLIKPGVSLKEIEKEAEDFLATKNAKPSFKGLYGFPGAICLSLNEVIIHGIPTDYRLKEGDILGIDIGTELNGWFGDGAATFEVGKISEESKELIECAKAVLLESIAEIKAGMRFKELSFFLEEAITSRGYEPLRGFCGHGIGKRPHEEPEIPNYLEGNNPKQGPKMKEGMVFCIEPMICQKDGKAKVLEDKWSVVSEDGLYGSHYEHTVAIINNRAEILSKE